MGAEGGGCQLIREQKGDLLGDLMCLQKGEDTRNLEKWSAAKLSEELKSLAYLFQVINVLCEDLEAENYLLVLEIII